MNELQLTGGARIGMAKKKKKKRKSFGWLPMKTVKEKLLLGI